MGSRLRSFQFIMQFIMKVMFNYMESFYKKESTMIKTDLEPLCSDMMKIKATRNKKCRPYFSSFRSLSSFKLVSSVWKLLVKLNPIQLWSEFSLHSDKNDLCHLTWKKENLYLSIWWKKKHTCHCMPNSKRACD